MGDQGTNTPWRANTVLPLVDATPAQLEQLRTDLVAGGVKLPGSVA